MYHGRVPNYELLRILAEHFPSMSDPSSSFGCWRMTGTGKRGSRGGPRRCKETQSLEKGFCLYCSQK